MMMILFSVFFQLQLSYLLKLIVLILVLVSILLFLRSYFSIRAFLNIIDISFILVLIIVPLS
jgi:hypothetical protein